MGKTYYGDNRKIKIYLGSTKIKSMYYGNIKVYPNAGMVTYYVDTNKVYQEEVDIEESTLNPITFTPSKSGYTFIGWREDMSASSLVLSNKVMDEDGNSQNLYAVFRKTVTVTKYNGSTSATTESKYQYYNNGNIVNPSFTLIQNGVSGWSALGWCSLTSATASVVVSNGGSVSLPSNATYYGKYSRTVTVSYNGNGNTGGSTSSQSGTRYWNSAGNYSDPSFTLRSNGFTRTNYSFVNWRMGSTSGTAYNAGASVTLSANTTMYAAWNKMYVDVSGASGSYADEIALYRPANTTTNDSSKVVPFPISASGDAFQNGGSGTISVLHYVKSATITFSGTGRNAYSGAAAGERLQRYNFELQILINGSVVKTQTIETGRQYPYDEDGGYRSGTVSYTGSLNAGDKITLKIFFTWSGSPNTGTPQCNVGSMSFSITGYSY